MTWERGKLSEQLQQAIVQQKSELLDLLRDEARNSSEDARPIPRDRALPLSSFQMRLWVLHQLDPDSTAYNMVTAWLHQEEMDAAAIEWLIRGVLQENEILRATFRDDSAEPGVYPLPPEAVRIVVQDLRGLSSPEQDTAIRAGRMAETRTPFKLSTEAPTRWTLYRVAEARWVIMVAAHHIVVDEWSLTLLRRRIESAQAPPPSALQYADYAAWQRRSQDPTAIRDELAWWEGRLAGLPSSVASPPTGPRTSAARGDQSGRSHGTRNSSLNFVTDPPRGRYGLYGAIGGVRRGASRPYEIRARILELAAALDRIDRAAEGPTHPPDRRLAQIRSALETLVVPEPDRAETIQRIFSLNYDPNWLAEFSLAECCS